MRHLTAVALLLLAALPLRAQERKPFPTPDSLLAISRRGVELARYDLAAWHGTDAVLALRPDASLVEGYVAWLDGTTWTVSFGRLTADRSGFVVAYEARQAAGRPESFVATAVRPLRTDTGVLAGAFRAMALGRAEFGTPGRPYNAAVLPVGDGSWWVYLMPAQTQQGVYPLGGDVRFHVSADGRRVLARRQLHTTIIESAAAPPPPTPGSTLEAGFRTALLDDVPEDTDVFHVLVRRPQVPQYIVTSAFVYRIETDGSVRLLGRREDVIGR